MGRMRDSPGCWMQSNTRFLSVLHLGLARKQISHPLDGSGFLTPRREGAEFQRQSLDE